MESDETPPPTTRSSPRALAGGRSLEDVIGNFFAVDGVAAEARGEGEVDSAEDYACEFGRFLGLLGHGFQLIVGGDRLEVEEEFGLLLLFLGVNLADGLRELGEGVSALDHGCDDIIDADLLTFDQVAHRFAAADFQGEFEVGLSAYFDEAQSSSTRVPSASNSALTAM